MSKIKYSPKRVSKAIGLKARQLREEHGWTLEKCEELGWPDWTHLQKVESGKNMTVHTLVKLANLLRVHPAVLLEDI
jgi:hypothetical protein